MPPSHSRSSGGPRRLVAVAAALAVIASIAGTGGAADARTADPTVSIRAERAGALTAPDVLVTGRLTRGGTPLPGRTVAVQVRTRGTSAWRTMLRTSTRADGRVQVSRSALKRSKEFRVRYRTASSSVDSPIVMVPVATSITVSATSNVTPTAGDEVVLSGTTSPGLVGARVRLQLLVGGVWHSVSSSVVTAAATYTVRAIATIGGDQQYRAVVLAAPGRPETASAPQDLTVYAWYRLARAQAAPNADGDAALAAGRVDVAGMPFADGLGRSLPQGSRALVSYDLRNRCLTFRSTYGPSADSQPGFYGTFRARADDDTVVDAQVDRGSTRAVQADITGASRITLISSALTGDGDAAWGDPEVLCAGL